MSNSVERWFENRSLSPFRDLSQLQDSFDRLFDEVASMRRLNGLNEINFSPSCEVAEEGNNYVLKFDIPGVSKDHVKVEVDKNQLTVWAERKEEKKSESKKKYFSELYYGSYTRSFSLPGPVDEKMIDAKFENGVLTVTIPKTGSLKVKQIPIN